MKSDLSKLKVGEKIFTIQYGWTKVVKVCEDSSYPINTIADSYTIDGKTSMNDKYPSAFLECPFKDLPIEKDTLVWYRDVKAESWRVGYYSHFENGQHFCFIGSRKSTEAEDVPFCSYLMVTTENPLT